jgi:prepilin-type processing-associated H-X9-DG protein
MRTRQRSGRGGIVWRPGRAPRAGISVRAGFAPVELFAVLAVVLLLGSLCATGTFRAREKARSVQCREQMGTLGRALKAHHDAEKCFPPGSTIRASFTAFLLPYLDRKPLAEQIRPRDGVEPLANETDVPVLKCPTNLPVEKTPGGTTYLGSSGLQEPRVAVEIKKRGVFRDEAYDSAGKAKTNTTDANLGTYAGWSARLPGYFKLEHCLDGAATTVSVGETTRSTVKWCPPYEPTMNTGLGYYTGEGDGANLNTILVEGPPVDRALFSSNHGGGANLLFVDGSARFVSARIAPATFAALLTIRGMEKVELPK